MTQSSATASTRSPSVLMPATTAGGGGDGGGRRDGGGDAVAAAAGADGAAIGPAPRVAGRADDGDAAEGEHRAGDDGDRQARLAGPVDRQGAGRRARSS